MLDIVLKMLDNWHWIIILWFVGQFLKIASNAFLRIYEIKSVNKDTIKIGIHNDSKVIEITSSSIKLQDLKELNEKELLEFKKSS